VSYCGVRLGLWVRFWYDVVRKRKKKWLLGELRQRHLSAAF
jgi:hypothetical protein